MNCLTHPRRGGLHTAQTALVTGGNTGIGYEMAAALAAHGATVLVAWRSKARVDAAVQKLKAAHPSANVSGYTLDLAAFRFAARAVWHSRVTCEAHVATLNGTCTAALRRPRSGRARVGA